MPSSPRRSRSRLLALLTVAVAACAGLAATADAQPGRPGSSSTTTVGGTGNRVAAAQRLARQVHGTVRFAVNVRPGCARPANPRALRCFAVKRHDVTSGTKGAYPYVVAAGVPRGPSGGYTPADLATAYGYDANTPRSNQTVAIVDWNDDPHALSDLNAFDKHYKLPTETATSFQKLNQNGKTKPLPAASHDSSTEIALDIETVRAVCHTCRIRLLEANFATDANLALTENTAARIGATEISNSFGEPELNGVSKSYAAAFNHPGIVITASTGDDGWYGWDYSNAGFIGDETASFPSTSPYVVSVGGTDLQLNANATRRTETVWNDDGRGDSTPVDGLGDPSGATGGGCSQHFPAQLWQYHYAGFSATGCGHSRLAADVAADAAPSDGLDVYDTYGTGDDGWATIGGTSLSSPLTAAMFALAGGAGGAAYPASSLYVNAKIHSSSLYDVQPQSDDASAGRTSGSSWCGGDTPANCSTAASHQGGKNPDDNAGDVVDCSYTPGSKTVPTRRDPECNTTPGFDGPSGVGTPLSLRLLAHTNESVAIDAASTSKVNQTKAFTAVVHEPVAGAHIVRYLWNWGDGTPQAYLSYAATHHTYRKKGTFVVSVTVTDSVYQIVVRKAVVKVS